tara:strand:- start:853 stop:975 length:123 start_codon:yes stop_codon:yes gene_type:complete
MPIPISKPRIHERTLVQKSFIFEFAFSVDLGLIFYHYGAF